MSEPEYTENELHYVADVGDFKENGDRVLIDLKEREVAVIYTKGEYYAVLNFCTHQGGPICEGSISGTLGQSLDGEFTWEHDDELISCPWHGWEFDLTSGDHITRSEYSIPTYETVVRDGSIYVVLDPTV